MTGFDYVVFLVVAVGAIGGFFRGFVEEVLSLAAWCIVLVAVHYGLEPLTEALKPHLKTETGAGVLAQQTDQGQVGGIHGGIFHSVQSCLSF